MVGQFLASPLSSDLGRQLRGRNPKARHLFPAAILGQVLRIVRIQANFRGCRWLWGKRAFPTAFGPPLNLERSYLMIRNGVIAAAAVLALGTVAIATDASAQGREQGGRSGTAIGTSGNVGAGGSFGRSRASAGTNVHTSGNLGARSANRGELRGGTGFASTSSGTWTGTRAATTAGVTRTGWSDRGDWRRNRFSGGWGWGPSFGVGFAAADYGYGYDYDYGWGPGYGYAYGAGPSYVGYGASYGGCNCGYPGYAYGYDYDYPGYAYAAPVGFGVGFGFSGRPFHRHW